MCITWVKHLQQLNHLKSKNGVWRIFYSVILPSLMARRISMKQICVWEKIIFDAQRCPTDNIFIFLNTCFLEKLIIRGIIWRCYWKKVKRLSLGRCSRRSYADIFQNVWSWITKSVGMKYNLWWSSPTKTIFKGTCVWHHTRLGMAVNVEFFQLVFEWRSYVFSLELLQQIAENVDIRRDEGITE